MLGAELVRKAVEGRSCQHFESTSFEYQLASCLGFVFLQKWSFASFRSRTALLNLRSPFCSRSCMSEKHQATIPACWPMATPVAGKIMSPSYWWCWSWLHRQRDLKRSPCILDYSLSDPTMMVVLSFSSKEWNFDEDWRQNYFQIIHANCFNAVKSFISFLKAFKPWVTCTAKEQNGTARLRKDLYDDGLRVGNPDWKESDIIRLEKKS